MAHFEPAVEEVIQEEGGLSNNANDHGGITKYGIILADLQEYGLLPVTADTIRNLTVDQAKAIYRKLYWDKMREDEIVSDHVADLLFDQAVLSGVGSSVKVVQQIIGASVDGVVGPETIGKLNAFSDVKLEMLFIANRLEHYTAICEHDHSQLVFLCGWVNRSAALLRRMAS